MEARTETNLAMNRVNIRFAGFTEGLPPFGRLPLFAVEIELNGLVARGLKSAGELDRMGLVIPETEERRMVDALSARDWMGRRTQCVYQAGGRN